MIQLQKEHLDAIHGHGAAAYPNECCGVLLGKADGERKVTVDALALDNARRDSPRNRFLILPEDFLRADREARRRGVDILGFYHSHPDHPARPSEYDRQHAWPWYTYCILGVEKGTPRDLTAWLLSEDGEQFLPEPLEICAEPPSPVRQAAESGGGGIL